MGFPSSPYSLAVYVRTLLVGVALLCAAPRLGYAGCSLKPYDLGFSFSDAALEFRDAFFASLCDQSFFELVMLPDPRLKERITAPAGRRQLVKQSFPEQAGRLGLEGTAVVAYVVETDGSVNHAITIESSGHKMLDDAAVAQTKTIHFDSPGTLDGLPVRVMLTHKVDFKLNGFDGHLPAAVSDEVIIALGNRLIDYCNRRDVDSLYGELDSVGKKTWSLADLKQELRIYNGLYGQIAAARYHGRLTPELTRQITREITTDVPAYGFGYELKLDRSSVEKIWMTVTIVDRGGTVRIVDFEIRRGLLIRRHRASKDVH
jgi:TonB family protein